MAEALYFIKTNPVAAKINLYNKLCREEESVLEFLDENKKTSLEIIKKKVQEDIDTLSKEELLQLFDWFEAKCKSGSEEMKTELFVHGIDLFYEIPFDENANYFQEILSDYEKHSQKKLKYAVDAENFNQFLIYGIFYTGFINDEQNKESYLSDFLKSEYKNLYHFAEIEFNLKKAEALSQENMYSHFTDLYDCTKFYKGSIIMLKNS
ncbi:hypothetical protein [Chryseobacterium daeguense]|uniref:hypothetical protein n=1 Tax=Chryseobacterium daeguense TaxID=412438 RepID=UPI0004040D8A|nr:hypothetical protein [Chryseobacterium daeguense]